MPWKIDRLTFTANDRDLIEAEAVDHEDTRSGVDGTHFQVDAWRAPSNQVITTWVDVPTAEATAFRQRCKKLETKPNITVIDQHGWSWTVYVRRVRVSWRRLPTNQYEIKVEWALVPRSLRP